MPKDVRKKESDTHGRVEAGFGEPEPRLGLHYGRGLLLADAPGAKIDPVADEGVEGKDANSGDRSLGHLRIGEVMGGAPGDPKGRPEHDQADREADEIFQFTDSVGEVVVGGSSNGAYGQKSGKNGEEIGGLLQQIAENREGVGEVGSGAHESDIEQAEGECNLEAAFACSGGGGGGHGRGWQKGRKWFRNRG